MLLSVLVLAAIGVAISSTLMLLSISNVQTAAAAQDSQFAKSLANTCAELGLEQLVASATYLGSGSKTLQSGTCGYTVATYDASDDVVTAQGTSNQSTRKVKIIITIPGRSITLWQEVADF